MSLPSANSNNVTDRRSASPKRDTDISPSTWPTVTLSVYQNIHRQVPAEMQPKLRQLCLLRVRIGQALLICDNALLAYQKDTDAASKKIVARLRTQRDRIQKVFQDIPLEIR